MIANDNAIILYSIHLDRISVDVAGEDELTHRHQAVDASAPANARPLLVGQAGPELFNRAQIQAGAQRRSKIARDGEPRAE